MDFYKSRSDLTEQKPERTEGGLKLKRGRLGHETIMRINLELASCSE